MQLQHLLRRHVQRAQLVQDLPFRVRGTGRGATDELLLGAVGRAVAQDGLVAGTDRGHPGSRGGRLRYGGLRRGAGRAGLLGCAGTREHGRGLVRSATGRTGNPGGPGAAGG